MSQFKQRLGWRVLIALNVHWLGISTITGTITPVLLPYLVALFAPAARKNSYLATVRVVSLGVAMAVQPMAGLLSDRSTLRWGRRRPFILLGTVLTVLSLLAIGLSSQIASPTADEDLALVAYLVLLTGIVLWQASSNLGQGALQGLIPDLVPENQRGQASGVKATMEVLAAVPVIAIGPLIDAGNVWLALGLVAGLLCLTTLVTLVGVREKSREESREESCEEPREAPASRPIKNLIGRMVALALLFVVVTQAALWLVRTSGVLLAMREAPLASQVVTMGLAGLLGMTGAIFLGVYFGARIGIGPEATRQASFVWWIINRLLFFAAVGSIQGFLLYFLRDVHYLPDVATATTVLLGVVAAFLILSAVLGGYLADRVGHRRLVALSCLVAAAGTGVLLLAPSLDWILVSGCILGVGAGVFWSTNWALGTHLVPPSEAGRYLGIANLAGAGAGIVGAGIGGPMADFLNGLQSGLGYQVIFGLYGLLFLLSAASLTRVKRRP